MADYPDPESQSLKFTCSVHRNWHHIPNWPVSRNNPLTPLILPAKFQTSASTYCKTLCLHGSSIRGAHVRPEVHPWCSHHPPRGQTADMPEMNCNTDNREKRLDLCLLQWSRTWGIGMWVVSLSLLLRRHVRPADHHNLNSHYLQGYGQADLQTVKLENKIRWSLSYYS
jgi:hypothetical protein